MQDELAPSIFINLQSVYKDAVKCSHDTTLLKTFQQFLGKIKKDKKMISETSETNCLLNESPEKKNKISKLLKSLFKCNYIILSNGKDEYNSGIFLSLEEYIQEVHIECARKFWNQCFLFYHKVPPVELKRNHLLILNIINDCIISTIRRHLDLNIFFNDFLVDGDLNNLLDFKYEHQNQYNIVIYKKFK